MVRKTLSQKKTSHKRAGGVAQVIGPVLKPPYPKKKKKKKGKKKKKAELE
jgi:hypothetical protein